ncbi:hypothetical protein HAQ01_00220 [Acidithiobacillus thiooxidans]|uniref:FliH/SctL family protein n=1 Tax=Acidithiobacillus thiooxidans TaxID=930 RepID=UPI001C07D43C|nr:FliH/SctL family protein [Acidithiobacillus thiooxidans]MBU2791868.1 hypothetical protein [Acidithiobacillus thiooxidans]
MNHQQITPFRFDPLDKALPDADVPAISAPSLEPPDLEALHHAEIKVLRETARQEGFDQGHAEGLVAGKAAGYEEGFAQGNQAGYQEGLGRADSEVTLLTEAARQWRTADASIAAFLEQAVLHLSIEVARQVIRKEVSTYTAADLKTYLADIVQELHLTDVSVAWSLHPTQISILESLSPELPTEWSFHADPQMSIGGARIRAQWPDTFDGGRTVSQEWDARLETRWSEVVARILGGD